MVGEAVTFWDANDERFMCDAFDPDVFIKNRQYAKTRLEFTISHAPDELHRWRAPENDGHRFASRQRDLFQQGQKITVDVRGMTDREGSPLQCDFVPSQVECQLCL